MEITFPISPFLRSRKKTWLAILTMKFFLILTIAGCLQAAAHGYGQPVSLNLKEAPLESAFRLIREQTGYRFVYTRTELAASRPVTLQVSQEPVRKVLELLFSNQPLDYVIDDNYIVVRRKIPVVSSITVPAAPIEITIRVFNEEGQSLAGASILLKNSKKGGSTDSDGLLRLADVEETDVLVISSVGYQPQEIKVGKETSLHVYLLRSVSQLDESVVIAYGTTTRRLNTGSVGKINSVQISQQPVSNPLAALQGRIPGLLITQSNGYNGSGYSILLRGQQSLLQGTEPFILIDGVPAVNGNSGINQLNNAASQISPLNSLNPADIESIEVLKDADATALYGSRGANGVILITTKKGQSGKTSLQFNCYSGSSRVSRSMEMLDTRGYLAMRREAFANDQVVPTTSNAPDLFVFDTSRYTDFRKLLIGGTAKTFQADLGITGGNEFIQFRLNGGYHRERTVLPTDLSNDRFSFSNNLTHTNKRKNLRLQFGSNYALNRNRLPAVDLAQYINTPPHLRLYDSAGKLNWKEADLSFRSLQLTNPLAQLSATYRGHFQHLAANLQVSYIMLRGLSVKMSAGFNSLSGDETKMHPSSSIDPAFTSTTPYSFFGNSQRRSWIAEPQLEYQAVLGKGKISLLAGTSFQEVTSSSSTISASNYSSDMLLGSVSGAGTVTAENSRGQYRYAAVFGRVNYQLSEKYLVNLTGRRDGSSRFGPGRQFAHFGAAGLGWIFSKEAFFQRNFRWLSFGKIRFSYGLTGNDQIGDYQYLDSWTATSSTYLGISTLQPSRLYNPDYSWEENRKTELGLELGLLRDRVLFTLNYFQNRSGNQLVNYSLPIQTGFSSIGRNLPALIQNKGIEAELSAKLLQTKKINWQAAFHLTIPRNKLVDFPGLSGSTYANTYIIGEPVSARLRYEFLGVDPQTGVYSFTDLNRDGLISLADRKVIVCTDPRYYGGFSQSLRAGNFSADVFFEYRRQPGRNYLAGLNVPGYRYVNQPVIIRERWTRPGDIGPVQRYTTVTSSAAYQAAANLMGNSDGIYSDASFLRCKTIAVGWKLPGKWLQQIHAGSARLYLQCQNLFVLTSYKGADPENQSLQVLPPLKTVTAGIQLTL